MAETTLNHDMTITIGKLHNILKELGTGNESKIDTIITDLNKANESLDLGTSSMGLAGATQVALDSVATHVAAAIEHFKHGDPRLGVAATFQAIGPTIPVASILVSKAFGAGMAIAGPTGVIAGAVVSILAMVIGDSMTQEETMITQFDNLLRHLESKHQVYAAKAISDIYNTMNNEFQAIDERTLTRNDLETRFPTLHDHSALQLHEIEHWLLDAENRKNMYDWEDVAIAYLQAMHLQFLFITSSTAKLVNTDKPSWMLTVVSYLTELESKVGALFNDYQDIGDYFHIGDNAWLYRYRVNADGKVHKSGFGGEMSYAYVTPSNSRLVVLGNGTLMGGDSKDWGHHFTGDCEDMHITKINAYGDRGVLIETKDGKLHSCTYTPDRKLKKVDSIDAPDFFAANTSGRMAIIRDRNLIIGNITNGDFPKENSKECALIHIDDDKFMNDKSINGLAVGETSVWIRTSAGIYFTTLPPYTKATEETDTPEHIDAGTVYSQVGWVLTPYYSSKIKSFQISRDNVLTIVDNDNNLQYKFMGAKFPFTIPKEDYTFHGQARYFFKAPLRGAETALTSYGTITDALEENKKLLETIKNEIKNEIVGQDSGPQ